MDDRVPTAREGEREGAGAAGIPCRHDLPRVARQRRRDPGGSEQLRVGCRGQQPVEVLGRDVVGVLVRDDDAHEPRRVEGGGEAPGVDDEARAVVLDDQAGVLALREDHGATVVTRPARRVGGGVIAPCTPGGYAGRMIDDIKKRSLHRARILQGQMRGIEKMIENDEYCVDIITQSLAVQKSLRSLNKLLVENHLRTHVSDMFEAGGDEREKAMAELLAVYELQQNRGN